MRIVATMLFAVHAVTMAIGGGLIGYAVRDERATAERVALKRLLLTRSKVYEPVDACGESTCTLVMGERDFRVRVVSRAKFEARYLESNAPDSRGSPAKDVSGFSFPTTDPCEVWIPSGSKIAYEPATGHAYFRSFDLDMTIAHEFAHCYAGGWHGRWDLIAMHRKLRDAQTTSPTTVAGFGYDVMFRGYEPQAWELSRAATWRTSARLLVSALTVSGGGSAARP